MALTATATQGFEPIRKTCYEEIFYLPGDPGDTFTRGDGVYINNGVLDVVTDSLRPIGSVVRTTVCPAATQGFPGPGKNNPIEWAAEDKTLVPVRMNVAEGVQVYKCTFANHTDEATVAAYTAATPSLTLTTATGANDDTNGAIIYVYAGPGKGQINVGADYVQTSKVLTTHRVFGTAITTSSDVIILEGEGGGVGGIGFLGRMDVKDKNELDISDGYDDGDMMIWGDFVQLPEFLQNLTLPVISAHAFV